MVSFASSAKVVMCGAAIVSFASESSIEKFEVSASLVMPDTSDIERENVIRSIPSMDDLDLIAIDPPKEWIDENWDEYA